MMWPFRRRTKALPIDTAAGGSFLGLSNQANFPDGSFVSLARQGYQRNSVVFACVSKIASSFPEAPLVVEDREGEALAKSPLRQLMNRPNEFMSEWDLWEITLTHFLLAGNAYWLKRRSGAGRVVELWPLEPHRLRIVPDRERFISHYLLRVGSEEMVIAVEDLVHFKTPNALSPHFGQPPLLASLRHVAVDNEATDFSKLMLENRAMPGVIVKTQSDDMTEEKADRIRDRFTARFGRRGDRGGVAVLQRGMDVATVGFDMEQIAFADLSKLSETRICAAFEVPPIVVGMQSGLERATYANYRMALQSFWEETVIPMQTRFASRLMLDPDFGNRPGIEISFDRSDVTALRRVRQQRMVDAVWTWHGGLITRNEARARLGLKPLAGDGDGDKLNSNPFQGRVAPRQAPKVDNIADDKGAGVVEFPELEVLEDV